MLKINIYREVNHLCTAKCASLFWVSITKRNAGVKIQWRWSLKTLFSLLLVGDTSLLSLQINMPFWPEMYFPLKPLKSLTLKQKFQYTSMNTIHVLRLFHKLMQHQPEKKNHYFMFSPPLNYQINHPGHSYACNMSHDTDARSWLKNIL